MQPVVVLNVNDTAEVTLTPRGMSVLHERDPIAEKYDLSGLVLRTELWKLMNIFGESMIMGLDPCFADCRISMQASI